MSVPRLAAVVLAATLLLTAPAGAATVESSPDGSQIVFSGDGGPNVATFKLATLGGNQIEIRDSGGAALTENSDLCTQAADVVTCTLPDQVQPLSAGGGAGNDSLTMDATNGSVNVVFSGGPGSDTLTAAGGNDLLSGNEDDDILSGGAGVDQLLGDEGADTVDGGDGGDFVADTNDDPSDAGDPSDHGDTYLDSGTTGKDVLDWAYFSDTGSEGVRVSVGDDEPDGENAGEEDDDVQTGFEDIRGTDDEDVIVGGDAAETLHGEEGDDQLTGGRGADFFIADKGADTINARDGEADGRIDCFAESPKWPGTTDGAGDVANVDALPDDAEVAGCETVNRPAEDTGPTGPSGDGEPTPAPTSTPAPPKPPALLKAPTVAGTPAAGSPLACAPGVWSGEPTFAISWQGGQPPRPAGDGPALTVTEAHEGTTLVCVVRATNAAGTVTARRTVRVPEVERMPDLVGKPYADGKRAVEAAYGTVDFGTDREQDRAGKGIDQIPCAQGGLKGSCDRAKLKPGEIYAQTPKAGTVLAALGLGAPLLPVKLSYYDASKDEKKPAAGSPRRYGDNCPLRGSFDDDRRDAWLDGLIGEEEKRAKDEVARVECDVVIKAVKSDQTKDPYVLDTRVVGSGGRRRVQLKVSRPRYQDLAILVMHYRIRGRAISGQRFDPGLGRDGQLTTHKTQENQVCFLVHEAATGRPVDGAEITGTDPTGTPVRGDGGRPLKLKTQNGLKCGFFNIVEEGTYTFDFRYVGANGMDEEGRVLIGATDRNHKPFTLMSGYNLRYKDGAWVLNEPKARASAVQDDIANALRLLLSPFVALGNAISGAVAALNGPEKSVSFKVIGESPGPKPAVLAGDKKLKPSLAPPPVVRGTNLIGLDGATLIGTDGGTLVAAGGGNMVAAGGLNGQSGAGMVAAGGLNLIGAKAELIGTDGSTLIGTDGSTLIGTDGSTLIGTDGSTLIGTDGSTLVSRNGGGLIGLDGATLVAAGGGNVIDVQGRSVIAGAGNALPRGTMVAAGAGNAIPVAPLVAAGGGN